jgi:hypothetical protein
MRGRLPRGGWPLRAVIFLGPLVALLAGVPQGYRPPVWLVVVLGVFSFAFAAMPEHYVGSASLVIVVAWWVLNTHDAAPVSTIAAAGALLAAHLAATVAGYGPPQLAPDPGIVRLWVRRGVLLWACSALTWFVVDAERGRATSAAYWVAGLAAVLALTVVATAMFPAAGDRRT